MAMIKVLDTDTGIAGYNGKYIKTIAILLISVVIAGFVPAFAQDDQKVFRFEMSEMIVIKKDGLYNSKDGDKSVVDVVLYGSQFGNQLIGLVTPERSYALAKCSGQWKINEFGALVLNFNGKPVFDIHREKCVMNLQCDVNSANADMIIQYSSPVSASDFKAQYDKLFSFLKTNSLVDVSTHNKQGGSQRNGGDNLKKQNLIPRPAGLPDVVEMLPAKQLSGFQYAPSNSIGLLFKSTYRELGGLSLENCENHPLGLTNITWPATEMRLINDLVDNKYGFRAYYHEISYGQTFTTIILNASQQLSGAVDVDNMKAIMRSDRCGLTLSMKKDGTLSGVNSTWLFKPMFTGSIQSYDFASLEKKFRKQFEKYFKWLLNEFERQGYKVKKENKSEYVLTLPGGITSTIQFRPDKSRPLDSDIRISVYKAL